MVEERRWGSLHLPAHAERTVWRPWRRRRRRRRKMRRIGARREARCRDGRNESARATNAHLVNLPDVPNRRREPVELHRRRLVCGAALGGAVAEEAILSQDVEDRAGSSVGKFRALYITACARRVSCGAHPVGPLVLHGTEQLGAEGEEAARVALERAPYLRGPMNWVVAQSMRPESKSSEFMRASYGSIRTSNTARVSLSGGRSTLRI
mmetsp:Transcript_23161/g.72557  ORF Transcript_23161/g.72557 Transcript_23161/m.72557 type:complete len:209 (+) Transcript_23161:693-1319(+)